jgi:putative Holliday junction resolvase
MMFSFSPVMTEATTANPGRAILAIDYGRQRMGLALSDTLGMTARPLLILARSNRRGDLSRLREICRRHNVGTIVVGWPLHLDGSASDMGHEAVRFAERVRRNLGLPVHLVDERLSSWEARQMLETTTPGGGRKDVDDVAAAIILRDYLSKARRAVHGQGAEGRAPQDTASEA